MWDSRTTLFVRSMLKNGDVRPTMNVAIFATHTSMPISKPYVVVKEAQLAINRLDARYMATLSPDRTKLQLVSLTLYKPDSSVTHLGVEVWYDAERLIPRHPYNFLHLQKIGADREPFDGHPAVKVVSPNATTHALSPSYWTHVVMDGHVFSSILNLPVRIYMAKYLDEQSKWPEQDESFVFVQQLEVPVTETDY